MNDVQELLGRVADQAGRPVISTEAVYTRAARVRWRRRVTVSAAALAVAAVGVAVVPQVSQEAGTRQTSVAAPAEAAGTSGGAQKLAELLPADVGAVEQVSFAVLLKQADASQREEKPLGPLDGHYAVRRDGGVGYLSLGIMDREYLAAKTGGKGLADDLCERTAEEQADRADCVREELPDGRVLTIWRPAVLSGDGEPRWGTEFKGQLTLGDGTALSARDITGFTGKGSLGPVLASPPLTRDQLRTLMLSPELLPKK
ncbi:hypothetical protein OG230_24120 [Streptomyces sp. NBC_00234]|uniref:hypothetical protein n=1 Tax=Streptomyces sp. NBC_00234 TaxID=2903638 RepID=UPI002E28165D|nr:hypothetical protein [Streptomyces sp. NBC_00234]